MLTFDSNGLLFPYTYIPATKNDLKRYFVDAIPSDRRLENFEKYLHYSDELKQLLEINSMKQWVNGSFVTLTKNPKDIDFVTFIHYDLRKKLEVELERFTAKSANYIFGVDAYLLTVFPTGHEKSFLFQSDKAYWLNKFSRTRRDHSGVKKSKGSLEIIY